MVVGLDISLRSTGVAWIRDGSVSTWTIKSKVPLSVNAVAKQIMSQLSPIFLGETTVFIEDYAFGKFGKSSSVSSLIELTGIIQYELYQAEVPYYKLAPTLVKKFLSGKGVLPKDQIPLLIFKKFNLTPDTVDACDALAVADLGYACLNKTGFNRELTKAELSCIKNLTS